MLIKVAEKKDIAPGGMLGVKVNGLNIVICDYGGNFYAVERKCGHAAAYLERGALNGYILTCPLHCARFDITTGEALGGPVPEAPDSKYADPLAPDLETRSLKTYPVIVEGELIKVEVS